MLATIKFLLHQIVAIMAVLTEAKNWDNSVTTVLSSTEAFSFFFFETWNFALLKPSDIMCREYIDSAWKWPWHEHFAKDFLNPVFQSVFCVCLIIPSAVIQNRDTSYNKQCVWPGWVNVFFKNINKRRVSMFCLSFFAFSMGKNKKQKTTKAKAKSGLVTTALSKICWESGLHLCSVESLL